MNADYVPFYCEENIYRLVMIRREHWESQTETVEGASVLFISNEARQVALLHQKAGVGEHGVVIWDYHVVYQEAGQLFDLDSRLGYPIKRALWLDSSFSERLTDSYPELAPRFAVIPAARFVRSLSTDRRHMKNADGSFVRPPPAWAPPYNSAEGHTLGEFISGTHADVEERLGLCELQERWAKDR